MSPKKQKIIDITQWVLIVLLGTMLVFQGISYNSKKQQLELSHEINKENTYIRIYESQKANELKRENRELYDSIAKLKDVESAMIVKFQQMHESGRISRDKFTMKEDTVVSKVDDELVVRVDSIYHYEEDNDTIKLVIDVKAEELEWVSSDIVINSQFMIINREKEGVNETTIHHPSNTTIQETTMWHRKNDKKWYQRIAVSPQVGVGYGFMHNRVDIYAGVGVGYKF